MYSILKKCRNLNLPVDIQLELFDTMVLPVVMYGCEVWGFEKNNILESFCLQFYKILLGLKKCTPNCILYGELGRYPIDMFIKCRMIAFWQRIVCNSTGIKLMFVTLATYIIFESYEHRSKIILQLLTSFVFLKVGFAPHRIIYS